MVRRGEYLERAVAIPTERGSLEALFHRGERRPGVVIVPAHPFGGGTMESPIIAEVAWAVTRAGHPTLRFNYHGVGASAGTFVDEEGAAFDTRDAIDHLARSIGDRRIALVGLGFGAGIAAQIARDGAWPETIVLVMPDPDRLLAELEHHTGEVVIVTPERDDADRRVALSNLASRLRCARLAVIPDADRTFVRGLVDLGRVIAEAVSPPGLIDLG